MGKWLPISDLFYFEKGSLQSSKSTDGDFPFITAAETWKTHETFTHDCEALIFAMAASGSLGRTHYIKGKFISSDLCFILTPKENKDLDLLFYYRVFNFLREDIVKKTATGTSKLAINRSNFGEYKIPYFDYEHQIKFRDKIDAISDIKISLLNSFSDQEKYVSQLKQAILQEAIAGQLTVEWRTENPMQKGNPDTDAAALLAKIKAEKQRLIADGKLKKEKPLAEIAIDEVPFSIPDNWVWTNFGEVILDIEAGKSPNSLNHPAQLDKWGVIKMSAISWDIFLEDENKQLTENMPPFKDKEIKKDDFIMTRANTSELVAKSVIVGDVRDKLLLNDKTLRVRFPEFLSKKYFHNFNNGAFARSYYASVAKGSSPSMKNVTRDNIKSLLVPLPPLAEQKAIVEKVDRLMNIIDRLEQQIKHRKQLAEDLMQTVLREAFE
jgi:type I restriction enzyme S subunit